MNQRETARAARLMLVTPVVREAEPTAALLAAACGAGEIAAVLGRISSDDPEPVARALMKEAQQSGSAFLLQDRAKLAVMIGADGAHLSDLHAFHEAHPILKPALIAGAGGLASRHDAMIMGEAGADYVMFGEPGRTGRRPSLATVVERVAWWAEIFEVPCVAYAETLAETAALAQAGADFIALGEVFWCDPVRVRGSIAEAHALIAAPERVIS